MKKILSIVSYLFLSVFFVSGGDGKKETKEGGRGKKESSKKENGEKSTVSGKKSQGGTLAKLRGSLRKGNK